MKTLSPTLTLICSLLLLSPSTHGQQELKDVSVTGGLQDGKARLIIEGWLNGGARDSKAIFATTVEDLVRVTSDKMSQEMLLTLDILDGNPKELPLAIRGDAEIRNVQGENLQDWSLRKEPGGGRTLVLRPKLTEKPLTQLKLTVSAEMVMTLDGKEVSPLSLAPLQPGLLSGFVRLYASPELMLKPGKTEGLFPVDAQFLPERLRVKPGESDEMSLPYRVQGAYALALNISLADPEARAVVLREVKIAGDIGDDSASFVLSAVARVRNPAGAKLKLLSGNVALTGLQPGSGWRVSLEQGAFVLVFDRAGDFPVELKFDAAVSQTSDTSGSWKTVQFQVAASPLQPIELKGLPADTQFEVANGARPERVDAIFKSFLPADGNLKLSWKTITPESGGKLFFAVEMTSQINFSPGLMRQVALLTAKVMQGELTKLVLVLKGTGEVTRVQGEQVLAWNVEQTTIPGERRLIVQFNQPQKDQFALQLQVQTPLGAFPQSVDAVQIAPESATRFAGYLRIVNEGAVRLEVSQAHGLSQIAPDQFPDGEIVRAALPLTGSQRFAYRFSTANFGFRVQADQILPELSVSELLTYRLGENESAIDGEFEVDIREAPLRELLLSIPKDYVIARLNAPGLNDYFVSELADGTGSELRLVYGQPVTGRQVVTLRLERNQALSLPTWNLPRVQVEKAKSLRGNIAVSVDPGFRTSPQRTQGLTEIATAFFPKKTVGIQAAFRLSDPMWQVTMNVERLPQTVQVDAMHLFSIGEGIAYGSSVLNYVISGAPSSTFKVELSGEYFNVEFSGKDIRSWQKIDNGFAVQLHTPVSGSYTLLATYDRPFRAQGETLTFTGARPLDAQSEQGHTIVISAYQFQVKTAAASAGLLPLEPGEVPAEYRLFFDAPILAAYRYAARPFDLKLALSPLAQGDSLSQVVDRALLTTQVSKEGQLLTDARYFVKNRGHTHFRITLPAGVELWSATVDGNPVVPVTDAKATLIPIPQRADPNAVLTLDLKLAARSANASHVMVQAPTIQAPVMLSEWRLQPDAGQKLIFRKGSLEPVGLVDNSGFSEFARLLKGAGDLRALLLLVTGILPLIVALLLVRWTLETGGYKFSPRFIIGATLGLLSVVIGIAALLQFGSQAQTTSHPVSRALTFLAPVQQSGSSPVIEISNLPETAFLGELLKNAWPVLLALAVWVYGRIATDRSSRTAAWILGWGILLWGALRMPHGSLPFILLVILFLLLNLVVPGIKALWRMPKRIDNDSPNLPGNIAPGTALVLAFCLLDPASGLCAETQSTSKPVKQDSSQIGDSSQGRLLAPALASSVVQDVTITENFVTGKVQLQWSARKGQRLPILFEPAVLTRIDYPTASLKLLHGREGDKSYQQIYAEKDGEYAIVLSYQLQVQKRETESGFVNPVQHGLVNRLAITVANADVDVLSPQAVSLERESAGSNTVARLVLAPANDGWIAWKPRSRDVRSEKPVFYVEISHLFAPAAGVVEGGHYLAIRPARGELRELVLEVPQGSTITDVSDGARPGQAVDVKNVTGSGVVSLWRFDPDTRQLRIALSPPQSKPFGILVRSQVAAGALPFETSVGLLSVENAATQFGSVGVATGNEVQLDLVSTDQLSPINLEDFPAQATASLQAVVPGLAVRRSFRYSDSTAKLVLKAAAVEPDVRVETQDTLSLGEDRVVLAAKATVNITRAGIFKLSFVMPPGFEVDAISGSALSHWTESRNDSARVITLHLNGKTEGQHEFSIGLAGPGIKATNAWLAPQVLMREATKQRGSLLLVPEQGMRLQPVVREGVTQLDPQKAGITQKGVLAFRILQTPWKLALEVERVDPWVQVTSLQHASIAEAQMKVSASLQYQIENTGLKAFRVHIPTNADNVKFQGDQVADYVQVPGAQTNGLQLWEVKLHRAVLGSYRLQATFNILLPEQAQTATLRGIQSADVNLQRGFVTIESKGRLQIRIDSTPEALQPAEWQSIPQSLRTELNSVPANYTFRLVEPAFTLALGLDRHQATKLLPARINNVTFTSVVTEEGVMLTQARIEILPGDKRLLELTLPKNSSFWFAFVNQSGVWPWRDQDRILIPLEKQSRSVAAIPVEIFYTSRVGLPAGRSLNLQLLAPKFDLPLENITWHVSLSEHWRIAKWSGSLQMAREQLAAPTQAVDVSSYLQTELTSNKLRTKEAENLLNFANNALQQGDPQEARRAFQAAYGLSKHDAAFNEDARVQLHNVKIEQALIGLNMRQATASGEAGGVAAKLQQMRGRGEVAYSRKDAKDIFDNVGAEDNAALTHLAERIIQQQDAAVTRPAGIRANIPQQGRVVTFKRSVLVDPWADLHLNIKAKPAGVASIGSRLLTLCGSLGLLALLALPLRALHHREP